MRVYGVVVGMVCALAGLTVRGQAQSFEAFGVKSSTPLVVPAFRDDELAGLMGTLDRLLADDSGPSSWSERAPDVLWQFARRMQSGILSKAQEQSVLEHLDQIARASQDAAAVVSAPRRMITELTVGKPAPEIVGHDLDGRPLKLSDYRDNVVVVAFSAEWCAICRTQLPYERFLLEKYERWPFALLGVETGSNREAARLAQASGSLAHRSWWDEPRQGETSGPIASAWNVIGWPATYIIDGDGVIRFVDLRDEDLLKGVRQLVDAQVDRDAKAKRAR